MCRIPKILIVAPEDVRADLRRKLGSLEYDIVAAVGTLEEATEISADAVVLWEPAESAISQARERGLKTVAIGGSGGSDLDLTAEDAGTFKSRVWELFRPS